MSRGARVTIGILLVIWGITGIARVRRVPRPAQARWAEAKAEAKARGKAPSTVPVPAVSDRYAVPLQGIVAPMGIILLGILLIVSATRAKGSVVRERGES